MLVSNWKVPFSNYYKTPKNQECLITTTAGQLYFTCKKQNQILLNFKLSRKGLARNSSQTFPRINTPTFSTPVILHTYTPMKVEQTECSETLAFKLQTPLNHPEESIQQNQIRQTTVNLQGNANGIRSVVAVRQDERNQMEGQRAGSHLCAVWM
jgi:hypothetical protein